MFDYFVEPTNPKRGPAFGRRDRRTALLIISSALFAVAPLYGARGFNSRSSPSDVRSVKNSKDEVSIPTRRDSDRVSV